MGKTKPSKTERNGGNRVGRFLVEFEVANNDDLALARRGKLASAKVRRAIVHGVVDSGARSLVLPTKVADELGLIIKRKVKVRYANRQTAMRDEAEGAHVSILGREGNFDAVLEPKRDTALIGAVVMEQLDFLIDNGQERLIPRDPDVKTYEIE